MARPKKNGKGRMIGFKIENDVPIQLSAIQMKQIIIQGKGLFQALFDQDLDWASEILESNPKLKEAIQAW